MNRKLTLTALGVAFLIIIALLIPATLTRKAGPGAPAPTTPSPPPLNVTWDEVVELDKWGYEPGIACDSKGTLYMTAHKDLDRKNTWDYLASWFFISKDGGKSWESPSEPFPRGEKWKTYAGDEGDIAIDGRDYVYFVDTYLTDNHIHVWANQGVYQYSVRIQKTTGLDDRPWIAAQGRGIVHYLGNNGMEVKGGRYWYYRSTNGARTFSRGTPIKGNGWAHIDAERRGNHVYIISESDTGGPADILVYYSDDRGETWNWDKPVRVAHRDGPGREYPVISVSPEGVVWCLWNDATNGVENGTRIFVGRSTDHGRTWDTWEVTPFKGFIDYPTINAGPNGSVAVAFYATKELPVSASSEWYLYGAMALNAGGGNLTLNFSIADPHPVYVGSNLHALHDFFEIVISPDMHLNIAYQYYIGPANGDSKLFFVRGRVNKPEGERRGTSPAPPSIYTSEAVRAITSAEVRLTHSSITPLFLLTASSRTTSRRASETPTTAGRR